MIRVFLILSFLLLSYVNSNAQSFFFDFENGQKPSELSGVGEMVSTASNGTGGSYADYGFGNYFWRNQGEKYRNPTGETFLTLSSLEDHNYIFLSFYLAVIDSWDGATTKKETKKPYSPDYLELKVNDTVLFQGYFDNFYIGDQIFNFSDLVYASSVSLLVPYNKNATSRKRFPSLGWEYEHQNKKGTWDVWPDSAYRICLVFEHLQDNLTLSWSAAGEGWQGVWDESFGIDNIYVETLDSPQRCHMPEPKTFVYFLLFLAVLPLVRRIWKTC